MPNPKSSAQTKRPAKAVRRPVALVTGGGTGLGLAIAQHFGREGYDLVIASRSKVHLEHGVRMILKTGARVLSVPTDVRSSEQVDSLIERIRREYGRLDVLVNNAAGNFIVPSERLTPNGWRAVVGIVLDGTFYCSRAAFPLLRASPTPAIVNIVAAYAWTAGPGTAHSAAAKAGVLALTRTLAVEWARYGIRVNAVAPGPIHTEGTDKQLWLSKELVERIEREIPMRRFGTADEIADAVSFLAGPRSSYVTGQVLPVDGGQWLGNGLMDLLSELPGDQPT
jgi:NAD(P)-dependent dehydrogenase (short-subunit alcohol dehydrogenase family)